MITQEIIDAALESLSNKSLATTYKKVRKDRGWVLDLLNQGYECMAQQIKLRSDKNEFLPYMKACEIMDRVALTISAVYEQHMTTP